MVVESDKADMDVEAFDEGYLAKIIVGEGETAPVGSSCAIIVPNEADVGKFANFQGGSSAPAAPAEAPAETAAPAAAVSKPDIDIAEIFMPALSSTMVRGRPLYFRLPDGWSSGTGSSPILNNLPLPLLSLQRRRERLSSGSSLRATRSTRAMPFWL